MNRLLKYIILCSFLSICGNLYAEKIETVSPDRNVNIIFELDNSGNLYYYVTFYGKNIINKSRLGIVLKGNDILGDGMKILNKRGSTLDEVYKVYAGKSSSARNHYNETTVELQETGGLERKLNIYFRVYDDGIAFRYEIPEQQNLKEIEIVREVTNFNFSENADSWAMVSDKAGQGFNYEGKYLKNKIDRLPDNKIVPFPITIHGNNFYATLSEANIHDYAGMYLKKSKSAKYGFESILAPGNSNVSVKSGTPLKTPWRMMVIGTTPGALIESNLVLNLNEPLMIQDPSWIKPGKSLWDWWAGWANFNAEYSYGMNTPTIKDFIDFASENGIDYVQVDATWYGSFDASASFNEYSNLSLTKSIPQFDLPYLANYANSKGVGLLLWMHWKHVNAQMDAAFPYYEQLGIKGVKIDFMDSDDQEMVNFYYRTVKKAAEHKLLVNFHGAYKPDGLRRTFPNLITREAVIGEEYSKWDNNPNSPADYMVLPFTRMVAGPLDITPGGVRPVLKGDYSPSHSPPEVLGTQMHQAAKLIVFESPLLTLNEGPWTYKKSPIFDLFKIIPASWDETRVLKAEIGKYIAIARRKGEKWFIALMTDWNSRNISLNMDFLPGSNYEATIYRDKPGSTNEPKVYEKQSRNLSRGDTVDMYLAPGGGTVIVLEPK